MHPSLTVALMTVIVSQPLDCYQTANFIVYAERLDTARQVAVAAEKCRVHLAKSWLGKELPDWSSPCRIDVTIADKVGGVTEVSFADGKVTFPRICIKGPLDRLLKGPLPHELTHVLFAHHFGRQPPRWADEGGAILSEGETLSAPHRKRFRESLAAQRQFRLREFLGMKQYPADIPTLYGQGHSVVDFLVAAKGRHVFLEFVSDGLDRNWDHAAKKRYGYDNVESMEQAWLAWVNKQSEPAAAASPRAETAPRADAP